MDRIVETEHGYDCIVKGVRYGTWRSKGEARGGLATEQARAVAKKVQESQTDTITGHDDEKRERLIGRWYQP